MTLFLARHGQTEANRDGLLLGRSDSPLTGEGLATARKLGRLLRPAGIAAVFASPLGRAKATAEIIAAGLGNEPPDRGRRGILVRPALAELSCGRWEGKKRRAVLGEADLIRRSWTARPPDGESYADGERRLAPLIEELRTLEGPALVVGHAGINRVLVKLWLGLDPAEAQHLDQPHQVVYVFEEQAPLRRLSADGRVKEGFLWEGKRPG